MEEHGCVAKVQIRDIKLFVEEVGIMVVCIVNLRIVGNAASHMDGMMSDLELLDKQLI